MSKQKPSRNSYKRLKGRQIRWVDWAIAMRGAGHLSPKNELNKAIAAGRMKQIGWGLYELR